MVEPDKADQSDIELRRSGWLPDVMIMGVEMPAKRYAAQKIRRLYDHP